MPGKAATKMAAQVKRYEARADQAREALSREQFALICATAASRSTNGEAYIRNVLIELCHWLQDHSILAAPPAHGADVANVQALVIMLYLLLDERCQYDFDVPVVLNAYSPQGVANHILD
jgi:hypothetical protein